ncbi:glycosyltransferase family 57 [Lecanosticta acicola]|uniref:Alpha-1,3-glucosyltransferase n=1 Tax=Lecanosticta acicola TaxID=111012 RepID=A0AAI8YZ71_9PEZI|nr:glycosyltransferase family 57 [Lecanosticta acicola]
MTSFQTNEERQHKRQKDSNAALRKTSREDVLSQLDKISHIDRTESKWIALLIVIAAGILLRCFAGVWGYSGKNKTPKFGDFEAQRHWMEITTQLSITEWYFQSWNWWSLDYPPLTAYHSWLLGKIGASINQHWFTLYESRGREDIGLQMFMRSTVLLSEWLIFIPATVLCTLLLGKSLDVRKRAKQFSVAAIALLLQPALIMVDHGHFQYNSVMLGFFMATLACLLAGRRLIACAFFVAALGFKQMALFYAPAMAAYLAGSCVVPKVQPLKFLAIATATCASFSALYLPILVGTWHSLSTGTPVPAGTHMSAGLNSFLRGVPKDLHPYSVQVFQTLHRIFPFSRGLFEDKVANIWCTVHFSGFYKLASHHSAEVLQHAALTMTLLTILPPCCIILLRPRKNLLLWAFASCAWGFFLCSYQVHEKNVLLPLLPTTALLAGQDGSKASIRAWVGFANIVGAWSLFHLLIKDEISVIYVPLVAVWTYLMELPPWTLGPYVDSDLSWPSKLLHLCAYAGIALWHILEIFVSPPANKPDLWIVINIVCACGAFCMCYLWCLWNLLHKSGLMKQIRLVKKMNIVILLEMWKLKLK